MSQSSLNALLELRLLVGFLGERSQFGWWPTAFFGEYSLRSLEFATPRTAPLAQYHGCVEAARKAHDELLNPGTYHLFRLPEELEQDLHNLMQSDLGAELAQKAGSDKAAALDALHHLAGTTKSAGQGPYKAGQLSALELDEVVRALASGYYAAFSQEGKAFPYLVA